MPTMQEMASEAVCSALYNLPFSKFLGERPDTDTGLDVAWFRLSRDPDTNVSAKADPKQVMVAVRREPVAGHVVVQVSWLNLTRGHAHPMRGEQRFRIATTGHPQHAVQEATAQAVLKVLEIYGDVLTESGVAGPLLDIAPKSEAGDPDDPEDMATPLQE